MKSPHSLNAGIVRLRAKTTRSAVTLAVVGAVIGAMAAPANVDASIEDWHKGVSIISNYEEQFQSDEFKQSIRDLADTNATHVTLVLEYHQDGEGSSDIYKHWRTPSEPVLRDAIDYIQSQGMEVVLKMHLNLEDEQWRAHIDPDDRDAWYNNYESIIVDYAELAQQEGVDGMIIGSELITVASSYSDPDNEWRWENMISSVRSVYDGWLTYNANWGAGDFYNEKKDIAFWDKLDYIGISSYYPLDGWNVESFKNSWDDRYWNDIEPFIQDNGNKQYLFSEVGYRSVQAANEEPWDGWGDTSQQKQAELYEALFEYWDQHDRMKGVSLWHWEPEPNAGGDGSRAFTPQNKQAEEVMTRFFGRGSNDNNDDNDDTDDDTNNDDGNPDAQFDVTASTQSATVGASNPIAVTVTNTGSDVSNAIVNVEVYNANGTQVYQDYERGQSFTGGQERSYQFSWTPSSTGEYTVKAGIFNSSWSAYDWYSNLATMSATEGGENDDGDNSDDQSGTYTFEADVPDSGQAGQTVPVDLAVTNNGSAVTNSIVDVEVYNSDGQKVWQGFRRWQWFDNGERNTYTFDWTPATGGDYTLKAGVFSQGWTDLFSWNNQLARIDISGGSAGLPDSITLDSPTDGNEVSGERTFRARLPGVPPSNYAMYWQVDGGQLNQMGNADDGYKRAFIDVTNWSWGNDSHYTITYIAEDNNGNEVADHSIDIIVNN